MDRIIKSEDRSYSIENIRYMPFEEGASRSNALNELPPEKLLEIRNLINDAKDEAEEIIQKAHHEADNIREKACKSGYEDGQEKAFKEMQERMDSIHNVFKKGIEDIASLKQRILSQSENDIVRLATAIAKRLACRELQQHPDTIVAIVKEAIKTVGGEDKVVIEVHPDDHAILTKYMDELRENPEGPVIRLEANPEVKPGGCIVVADTGLTDMSLEARMDSIDQLLIANNPP
jgi:flagellar biosynthesis/type III secretory pathway protein FliH